MASGASAAEACGDDLKHFGESVGRERERDFRRTPRPCTALSGMYPRYLHELSCILECWMPSYLRRRATFLRFPGYKLRTSYSSETRELAVSDPLLRSHITMFFSQLLLLTSALTALNVCLCGEGSTPPLSTSA